MAESDVQAGASSVESLEMTCFSIVAQVGNARSCFVEAIDRAEAGDFDAAEASIAEGDESFRVAHDVHLALLQREADGEQLPFRIIMLHAEDLMAGAELLRIMAQKMISLYRKIS